MVHIRFFSSFYTAVDIYIPISYQLKNLLQKLACYQITGFRKKIAYDETIPTQRDIVRMRFEAF